MAFTKIVKRKGFIKMQERKNYILVKADFLNAAIYSIEYCYDDNSWHGYMERNGKKKKSTMIYLHSNY